MSLPLTICVQYHNIQSRKPKSLDCEFFSPFFSDSAAERRRLAIQESKFLGGDMEHTHLVKGLDFALLQKVQLLLNLPINEVKHLTCDSLYIHILLYKAVMFKHPY